MANAVIDEAKRKTEGLGGELSPTFAEKIERAGSAVAEFKETIGKGLLGAISAVSGMFNGLAAAVMQTVVGFVRILQLANEAAALNPLASAESKYQYKLSATEWKILADQFQEDAFKYGEKAGESFSLFWDSFTRKAEEEKKKVFGGGGKSPTLVTPDIYEKLYGQSEAGIKAGRVLAEEIGKEWIEAYINGTEVAYHTWDVDKFIFDPIRKSFQRVQQLIEKVGIPGIRNFLLEIAQPLKDLYETGLHEEFAPEGYFRVGGKLYSVKTVEEGAKATQELKDLQEGKAVDTYEFATGPEPIGQITARIKADKVIEEAKRLSEFWDGTIKSMASSFSSNFIDTLNKGFENLGDAAKAFGMDILKMLEQLAINAALFGNIMGEKKVGGGYGGLIGLIGSVVGLAEGAVIPSWRPIPSFASGTVAWKPTLGVIGDSPGGEGEAVIPLKGGKVPVQMLGGRGGTTIINYNNYQITAVDTQSFDQALKRNAGSVVSVIKTNMDRNGILRKT